VGEVNWDSVRQDVLDASTPGTYAALRQHIITQAPRYGVDPALALAVAETESNFRPQAVSPTDVTGLFQVTNETGGQYGQTPATRTDPYISTHAGLSHLGKLLEDAGGNIPQALARYGDPKDTGYAQRVMAKYPFHRTGLTQQELAGPDWDVIRRQVLTNPPGAPEGQPPVTEGQPTPEKYAGAPMIGIQGKVPPSGAPGGQPPVPVAQPTPEMQTAIGAMKPLEPVGPVSIGTEVGALVPQGPPPASVKLTPGMSDEEIARAFGYDPALIQQAKLYQKGAFSSLVSDPNSAFAKVAGTSVIPGTKTATLGGVVHGLAQIPLGAWQSTTRGLRDVGLYNDADVAFHDLQLKVHEANYQQNILKGANVDPATGQASMWDIGSLVGQGLFPLPGGGAAQATGSLVRPTVAGLARSAVTGAAVSALQPVLETTTTPGVEGDPFAQQKASQMATGAIAAPVVEYGLARPLMWGINKAVNRAQGFFTRPEDRELLDLASAHGVQPTYADVRGKMEAPGVWRTEVDLEKWPLSGAGEVRAGQQQDLQNAVQQFRQHYVGEMGQASYDALPDVMRLASMGDKGAQRAVEMARQAGDDPGRILQASATLNMQALKGTKNRLYGEVAVLADPLGNVPAPRTIAQAYTALDRLQDSAVTFQGKTRVIRQIENILDRLEPRPEPPSRPANVPYWNPSMAPPVMRTGPNPYRNMDQLSNDLGTMLEEPAMRNTYGAKLLQTVKEAIDTDMRQFALQSGRPDVAAAQRAADAFYPRYVRQRDLVQSMENIPTDQLTGTMFKPRQAEAAKEWYNALDTKGQAAARAEVITQALSDGPNPALRPAAGGQMFSPDKFVGNIDRLGKVTGVVFPQGQQGQFEINGFVNLMRHFERAGQYAEYPPTGMRTGTLLRRLAPIGAAITGTATGGPLAGAVWSGGALLTEIAAGRAAKALLMTPGGRDFLLAASRLPPNSPQWAQMVNQLGQKLPAWTAEVLGNEAGRQRIEE